MNQRSRLKIFLATVVDEEEKQEKNRELFVCESVIIAKNEARAKLLMNPPLPEGCRAIFRLLGKTTSEIIEPEIVLISSGVI